MDITDLLLELTSGTNALLRASASQFNLTSSQAFHLLSIPYAGTSMSGLAKKLGLDTSTLTRNIQKLEALTYVKREKDSYDKRVQIVMLTQRGRDLVVVLEESLNNIVHEILANINLNIQEHLITVLESLNWSIDSIRNNNA